MISVKAAERIIVQQKMDFPSVLLPLQQTVGKILAENLYADRDFPPYNRVAMDGIAIQYAAFEKGIREFPVQQMATAGSPIYTLQNNEHCIEIMTGAILSHNADTVIRYEDVQIHENKATVMVEQIKAMQNVHHQGNDRKQGDQVVDAGTLISAAEIGVAATIGKTHLRVLQFPKVALISTGDELVSIGTQPLAHQIRQSNMPTLQAALSQWGFDSKHFHLPDEEAIIYEKMSNLLTNYPLILLSGGVSKGKKDYLPKVLKSLNVKELFHRIQQRPGKPFWFGKAATGSLVFAFPGNPVSTFVCFHRYFKTWLQANLGQSTKPTIYAILAKKVEFKPNLTYFMQVKTQFNQQGQFLATPVRGRGSGDLANLVHADGFLELPQGKDTFEAGETFPFFSYRW